MLFNYDDISYKDGDADLDRNDVHGMEITAGDNVSKPIHVIMQWNTKNVSIKCLHCSDTTSRGWWEARWLRRKSEEELWAWVSIYAAERLYDELKLQKQWIEGKNDCNRISECTARVNSFFEMI